MQITMGNFQQLLQELLLELLQQEYFHFATQIILDRKLNLKEVAVNAIGGAIKGGIAGSGIGIVGGVLATGATGAATSVATQIYADDKKLSEVNWGSVVIDGGY